MRVKVSKFAILPTLFGWYVIREIRLYRLSQGFAREDTKRALVGKTNMYVMVWIHDVIRQDSRDSSIRVFTDS